MSAHRLGRVNDVSRCYRDPRGIPVLPPRRSPRETMGSTRASERSELSPHGRTTSTTSQLRNESAVMAHVDSRSDRDARLHRDTQPEESARVERGSTDARERAATPPTSSKNQESMYSKEAEGTKSRDEVRRPKEEDRRRYDGDRTSNIIRALRYHNADVHRHPPAHAKDTPDPGVSPTQSLQHGLEASSREVNHLQHELRTALKEYRTLVDLYTDLKQASEEREKKLSTTRHEREAALEQRKEAQNAYAALKQQHDELAKKANVVRHEHKDALEQKRKAQEDCADFAQKYEAQKNEHHALSNKYQSLKAALEQRTSELQGVQKFLSTADTFSGSEVVNTLRRLNEEANQNTTFMAEWSVGNLAFETPNVDQATAQTVNQTRVSDILGTRLMELLGTRKNQDNPILVEMALRAYLMYELYVVASPWSIGQEERSHNQYIDTIYQRMREGEGQAVSGNWRALTRAYTLPACISDPELTQSFVTTIVSGFSDILLTAGCVTSKEDIVVALWSKFAERIHHFVSLAGQVNKIIGVGVISEDFEVLVVWPGAMFEEKMMEDTDDNGDRVRGAEEHQETVLCATEMGLMQRMRMGGTAGDKTKPTELIVIKPKVILASVLDALVE